MKAQLNGISTNYESTGQGQVLILIHGACDNLTMWRDHMSVYARRYRVVAYDIRGHGESDAGEFGHLPPPFVEDLDQLMRATGIERALLLGYSLGGLIAAQFAAAYPERVGALVCASSAAGFGSIPTPASLRSELAGLLRAGDMRAAADMLTARCFSAGFRQKHPGKYASYLRVKMKNNPERLAVMFPSPPLPPAPEILDRLRCPVLFIAGEKDATASPEIVRKAQARVPGSRLIVLPTGHASMFELPDQFDAAVLDFLASVST